MSSKTKKTLKEDDIATPDEIEEIAEVLEVSPATVKRDWQFARVWLKAELGGGAPPA